MSEGAVFGAGSGDLNIERFSLIKNFYTKQSYGHKKNGEDDEDGKKRGDTALASRGDENFFVERIEDNGQGDRENDSA